MIIYPMIAPIVTLILLNDNVKISKNNKVIIKELLAFFDITLIISASIQPHIFPIFT